MVSARKLHTVILSDNKGWIAVYVFTFLLLILAGVMSTYTIARFNIISGTGFEKILHSNEGVPSACKVDTDVLSSPEAWDHMIFSTYLIKSECEERKVNHYWKVIVNKQPYQMLKEVEVSSCNPFIVFLVQDSLSMRWSSPSNYDESRIYFKNNDGDIFISNYDLGSSDYKTVTDGIYFTGEYGNQNMKAPTSSFNSNSGTMPVSTMCIEGVTDLMGLLNMGKTAVAKTSKNSAVYFTKDPDVSLGKLKKISFDKEKAPVSNSLYKLLNKYPDECVSRKHAVILTDGLLYDDGDIPAGLIDYDGDKNPNDAYVSGYGSHCLDDVSAYAATNDVFIHLFGQENNFTQSVVKKGKGKFIPGIQDLYNEFEFISSSVFMSGKEVAFLSNRFGRFDPAWMKKDGTRYYKNISSGVTVCPQFILPGPLQSFNENGNFIHASSVGDTLNRIDIKNKRLDWSIKGIGGKVDNYGDYIIAGPSSDGRIYCINTKPEIIWSYKADFFKMTHNAVFMVKNSTITMIETSSGKEILSCHLSTKITSLNVDPVTNLIYAGTSNGKIVVISTALVAISIISTPGDDPILDIHAFTLRKQLYLTAFSEKRVFCTDMEKVHWYKDIDNGKIIQMLIMDSKVLLVSWDEAEKCGGIDTGYSYLSIYDALSGKIISDKLITSGYLFGPYIDLNNSRLIFSCYDMNLIKWDMSLMIGIKPVFTGTKLVRE